MHYYAATMKIVNTTSVTDFEFQDERVFTIVNGPYVKSEHVLDELPDEGVYYILRYSGVTCTGISLAENFKFLWDGRKYKKWSMPSQWEIHNLDDVFYELMSDARLGREVRK